MKEKIDPPPGWGQDILTAYMELAYQNRFATFHNKKEVCHKIIEIDILFKNIHENWIDPDNILLPFFFSRSHAAYRAACEHAFAGQITDTYPLLRSCLEYSAYALHIRRLPSLAEIWLNRGETEEASKSVRKEFQFSKVRKSVKESDINKANIFEYLYEHTIDFGAHPNQQGVLSSTRIIEAPNHKRVEQAYLHGDGPALDLVLKTTAQAGICALDIFQEVFPDRFREFGVQASLVPLRRGL
ncbi:MAG: hypothetical protein ACTS3R_14710 [Inquilinaceae bacterium]